MTGLECLRQEMRKRGCTKSQAESSTVGIVLDILANAGDQYTNQQRMLADIEQLRKQKMELENAIKVIRFEYGEMKNNLRRIREEEKQYIDGFYKALENCATPEAADTMRAAQMFVNSVCVDTKYDNTAYIIGLASILSSGKIGAINELKKINKKLPDTMFGYKYQAELLEDDDIDNRV